MVRQPLHSTVKVPHWNCDWTRFWVSEIPVGTSRGVMLGLLGSRGLGDGGVDVGRSSHPMLARSQALNITDVLSIQAIEN